MLCHYTNKSCDHKYCDGGDVIFLICQVTFVNTYLMGCLNLWVEARRSQSPSQHVSWPLV